MGIIASWDGGGLGDGVALTSSTGGEGDAPFNSVTAGAAQTDVSGARPPRIQIDQQAGTAAQLVWTTTTIGSRTDYAIRGYLELTAYPSTGAGILAVFGTNNTVLRWRLDITNAGLLRLRDASDTVVATSSVPVPIGLEDRVEVIVSGTTATVTVWYWDLTDIPIITLNGTVGGTADAIRWGNHNTSPTWPRFHWGTLAFSDEAAAIGPPVPQFPDAALPIDVELLLDGTWTRVTGDVKTDSPITITGGRADEGSSADPSKATLTLRNTTGTYSPRNPLSPYHGILGRNTPLRIRVPGVDSDVVSAYAPGYYRSYTSTPDAAALDITGDIDVRAEITPDLWRPVSYVIVLSKYLNTGDQRSWFLRIAPGGSISFGWTTDGTIATRVERVSTAAVPFDEGEHGAIRATLDVNNGASGNTVTFYTSDSITGAWTQLGSPVVVSGTTSIFSGTAQVEIGSVSNGDYFGTDDRLFHGRVHAVQIRAGIGGTLVADPGIQDQETGVTSWTGTDGRTWTMHGTARLLRAARFHGEVSSWPLRWGTAGVDTHTSIEAAGILRRLGQGASPLESPLRRSIPRSPGIVAYWSMEDGGISTRLASALPDGRPLALRTGEAKPAAFDGFVGSAAIPEMGDAQFLAPVPAYTVTGDTQVRLLLHLPEGSLPAARLVCQVVTTGTARQWDIWYDTSADSLAISVYDADGTQIYTQTIAVEDLDDKLLRVSLEVEQNGANLDWRLVYLEQGQSIGFLIFSTLNSRTFGRISSIRVGDARGIEDTAIGHLSINNTVTSIFDLQAEYNAYVGEGGGDRLQRLCIESGLPIQIIGEVTALPRMGTQRVATLLELLTEVADADGGLLHEPRDELGLLYRTRASLYNQDPALTLPYKAGLAAPLEPVDDDQDTRNDVTVERTSGSSARAVLDTGPLSVQSPPAGVGRYEDSMTINVGTDEQLDDQASWRLHLGTVDETRFPLVRVKLHKNPGLIPAAAAIRVRDLIRLTGLPPWLPPDDVDLIADGVVETLEMLRWTMEFNCSPGSPWRVAVEGASRYDTAGAHLVTGVDADDTSLSVATTLGPLWTTAAADMPFDIGMGGERITVTNVTGPSSPQTFTVTRSVNGIAKSHAAGAAISLWEPAVYAL